MKLWLKTLIFAVLLILGCVISFYAPDGTAVALLVVSVIMYVLSQS